MSKQFFFGLLVLGALCGVPANAQYGVYVNGRPLTQMQAMTLQAMYGAVAPPGRYWYDPVSGLYGIEGREACGFIRANHNFAPLQEDASDGDTGIFINGRELNRTEALFWRGILGSGFRQGRWWLTGAGLVGVSGNRTPLANVAPVITAILQQQTQSARAYGGDHFWSSRLGAGNSNGDTGYINVGGGQFYSWGH